MSKKEDQNQETLITKNFSETEELGFNFAKKLKAGAVICLYGNLGVGKTQFVKGLAKGLGIKNRIISPTFIIVRSYAIFLPKQTKLENLFYHCDLYRLEDELDIVSTGLLDILNEGNSIVAIEWPEKLGKFIPTVRWEINFKILINNSREIIIKKYDG